VTKKGVPLTGQEALEFLEIYAGARQADESHVQRLASFYANVSLTRNKRWSNLNWQTHQHPEDTAAKDELAAIELAEQERFLDRAKRELAQPENR